MTQGLVRIQQRGDLHFVTFSCYQRKPYLGSPQSKELFEGALERMRAQYGFFVVGYVVMPEHVHLPMSEPETGTLADALKGMKLSVTLCREERPFWSARYCDFNVFTEKKRIEKLKYIHRNPVVRGWVQAPEEWRWSSSLHYATGGAGTVEIESEWTARRRLLGRFARSANAHISKSRYRVPRCICFLDVDHPPNYVLMRIMIPRECRQSILPLRLRLPFQGHPPFY